MAVVVRGVENFQDYSFHEVWRATMLNRVFPLRFGKSPLPFGAPPKLLFPPKSAKHPAKNAMTIAIGFTTGNAVILCADSQETISDYTKTTTQKIKTTTFFDNWRLAIAGSSNTSHYLELFEQEVVKRLGKAGQEFDYPRTVDIIRDTLQQLHKKHIWPRGNNSDKPVLQFLIGIQGIKPTVSQDLLHCVDTAVCHVPAYDHYASIGVGYHMAKAIKDRLLPDAGIIYNSPAEVIAGYGIYMLWHVKQSVVGCDGNTLVLIMQHGKYRWMTQEEVGEIEYVVQRLYPNQRQLLSALFNPSVDMQGVANHTTSFVHAMTALKNELMRGAAKRRELEEWQNTMRNAQSQPSTQPKEDTARPSKPRKSKGRR